MNLVPKLGLLYDALILDPHTQEWCDGAISEIASIIASEKTLLRATKKADADRYRSLPTGDLQFLVDDDLADSD